MANRLTRRVVVGLAVLGVLGPGLLPPEHFHPSRDHDGRHADVVHRHLAPHHLFEQRGTTPQLACVEAFCPGVKASVDHTDDDAQYLNAVFVGPKPAPRVDPIQPFVIVDLPSVQPAQTSRGARPSRDVRVHDPPWRTTFGPRGPPALLV